MVKSHKLLINYATASKIDPVVKFVLIAQSDHPCGVYVGGYRHRHWRLYVLFRQRLVVSIRRPTGVRQLSYHARRIQQLVAQQPQDDCHLQQLPHSA